MEEVREVMEAEMRTQLRRQAAAHTDHLRDVLKVQEQELRAEAQEVGAPLPPWAAAGTPGPRRQCAHHPRVPSEIPEFLRVLIADPSHHPLP